MVTAKNKINTNIRWLSSSRSLACFTALLQTDANPSVHYNFLRRRCHPRLTIIFIYLEGGGVQFVHGRSSMTIDARIPILGGSGYLVGYRVCLSWPFGAALRRARSCRQNI